LYPSQKTAVHIRRYETLKSSNNAYASEYYGPMSDKSLCVILDGETAEELRHGNVDNISEF